MCITAHPCSVRASATRRTVAAPPQSFRTHHGGRWFPGQLLQRLEAGPELGAGHVVRIAAKTLHTPTPVRTVAGGATASTQRREMDVGEDLRHATTAPVYCYGRASAKPL